METAQIPIGATIMVPTDNSGYEPMVVVNSVGFGANAKVEAHPLASGGWSTGWALARGISTLSGACSKLNSRGYALLPPAPKG